MAVLDFPDSPTVGQLYGSTDTVWKWDGSIWTSTVGASGPRGRVAYAKVENNQGSITALVNLAGMSVSFTADPTRTYRTTIRGEVTPAVAGDLPVAEIRDASGTTKQRWTSPLPTVNAVSMHLEVVESGLSGPQTRYATLVKAAGTGSLTFGATPSFPAFILVEDITYEAGTSGGGVPGRWEQFTPVVTASVTNPTLGTNPTILAAYAMVGKTCHWRSYIAVTAGTPTPGSGSYSVSLPVPTSTNQMVGYGWMYGAAGFKPVTADGLDKGRLIMTTTGGYLSNAEGFNAVGHVLAVSGTYEVLP